MKIYELVHMHGAETLADGRFHYGDCAMLGCFSSAERVAAAIEKYRSIPGFCDYPNGFVVFAHEVEEHAVLVYLANVYIHDAEYEFEYSRNLIRILLNNCTDTIRKHSWNLGVFKNEGDARLAVEVFRQDNSTWWEVDGLIVEWSVDQYTLDEMNCIDGFEY